MPMMVLRVIVQWTPRTRFLYYLFIVATQLADDLPRNQLALGYRVLLRSFNRLDHTRCDTHDHVLVARDLDGFDSDRSYSILWKLQPPSISSLTPRVPGLTFPETVDPPPRASKTRVSSSLVF